MLLFLQAEAVPHRDVVGFLQDYWPILIFCAVGLAAVYLLLPRPRRYPLGAGILAGLAAMVLAGAWLLHAEPILAETVLFYGFAGLAVLGGGVMLAQTHPVQAALAFALVVLSTCGLFLLQAAPFLMAGTIIIYAGAIVVTFLFVIMLAQQSGRSSADQRTREPLLASLAGFVLLAVLLCVLFRSYEPSTASDTTKQLDSYLVKFAKAAEVKTNSLKQINEHLRSEDKVGERFVEDVLTLVKTAKSRIKGGGNDAVELEGVLRDMQTTLESLEFTEQDMKTNLAEQAKLKQPKNDGPQRPQDLATLKKDYQDLEKEYRHKFAELRRYLAKVYPLGVRVQNQLFGTLQPKADLPLSPYSGLPPSEAPARDRTGRAHMPAHNVMALGRSLFTDYLVAVELAATLLLVATIGAIAIAGRRTEGLR
jgi:NADH:ubiquinone oxidoreductase subunit 6 (subunit J)